MVDELKKPDATSFAKILPPCLAIIVFEYDPIGLWPVIIDDGAIMESLAYKTVPYLNGGSWSHSRFIACLREGKTTDLNHCGYHVPFMQDAILTLVRFSRLLSTPNILDLFERNWRCIGSDSTWTIDAAGTRWLVDTRRDLSSPSGILGEGVDPSVKTTECATEEIRETMRDCLSSLFGLLHRLGVDALPLARTSPLYHYLGLWRHGLSKIEQIEKHVAEGDWSLFLSVSAISGLLLTLSEYSVSPLRKPEGKEIRDRCFTLLETMQAKNHNFFPYSIEESRCKMITAAMPEMTPFFVHYDSSLETD